MNNIFICPHCHARGIGFVDKLLSSKSRPATCRVCSKKSYALDSIMMQLVIQLAIFAGIPLAFAAGVLIDPLIAIGTYALLLCLLFALKKIFGTSVPEDFAYRIGVSLGKKTKAVRDASGF